MKNFIFPLIFLMGHKSLFSLVLLLAIGSIKPENYKSAVEGSSVEIECGKNPLNPGDKVSWSKNRMDLSNKKRFSTNDKGYLIISPVEQDDNGLYTCASQRMIDEVEVTRSVNMYLNVKCKFFVSNCFCMLLLVYA